MKFQTLALIKVVETEIESRQAVYEETLAKVSEDYDAAKQEWLDSHHPAELRKAAQAVSRKIGRGQVISSDDVEAFTSRNESHVFNRSKPEDDYRVTRGGKPKTEALEGLLAVLNATTDEEVSAAALRDLGYRNLAPLLREAVSA